MFWICFVHEQLFSGLQVEWLWYLMSTIFSI
jgi:hypothetical protein